MMIRSDITMVIGWMEGVLAPIVMAVISFSRGFD